MTDRELDWLIATKVLAHPGLLHDFRPSQDIAAAWTVVEAMQQRGLTFRLIQSQTLGNPWTARFFPKYDDVFWGAESATPTRAICLAALCVIGVRAGVGYD